MSWRGKEKSSPGRTFAAPAGFRDSDAPALGGGEVVASSYQVRQPIARVDNGQIFEAWDMLIERTVALKIAWRDPGLAPLLPEARRASAVRDPASVDIYAMGNHRGAEFVVAERVGGRSATELVTQCLASGTAMAAPDVLEILVRVAQGVAAAHAGQVAIGEVSGETVLVSGGGAGSVAAGASAVGRVVLGALSMSQVPATGEAQVVWAPEIVTKQRALTDPGAAAGVDVYGIGCLAVELAVGRPPFLGDSVKATVFNHVHHRPPSISELRTNLPVELGDLVAELLDKQPGARPNAASVAAQLSAIAERVAATRRIIRILIVDDDAERVRLLWSILRRSHPRATVDAARDGGDAVGKLRRDRPDLVVVDTRLAGTMNALELCMYVSGLEDAKGAVVAAIVDDVDSADTGVLMRMGAQQVVARDRELPAALGALVRQVALAPRFIGGNGRITISG